MTDQENNTSLIVSSCRLVVALPLVVPPSRHPLTGWSVSTKLGCACVSAFAQCQTPWFVQQQERRCTRATCILRSSLTLIRQMRGTSGSSQQKKKRILWPCNGKGSATMGGWRLGGTVLFPREICQNNAYPGIVFSFNARKNAYFIVTPQRTNCSLF